MAGTLDKKVTSFVFGLVTAFGFTHARKFVIRRYGEDSQILRFLEEQFPQFAREVHDHLVAGQPPAQGMLTHNRSEFEAGLAAFEKQDWSRAYLAFLKADEAGDPDAANYLGLIYWEERVAIAKTLPDIHLRLATSMFEKAIAGGDTAYAPKNLTGVGATYALGKGVAKDESAAHRCYLLAAEAGYPAAMFMLAITYKEGRGTAKDWTLARRWFALLVVRNATDEDRKTAIEAMQFVKHMDELEAEERTQGQAPPSGNGTMTRPQALELLELPEGASKAEMKAAWVRLVQINHPDKGGSTYFMKQLNAARDVLGF